ncbi:MAG: hypothetical protein ACRBBN_06905 [Methyloligellaceae bacterium]
MSVIQIQSHHFCNDHSIAWIMISLDEISRRFDLKLEEYLEDGLGHASGCLIKTEKGYIYILEALEVLQGKHGPHFELRADATDIVKVGVKALVDNLKDVLSLPEENIFRLDSQEIERMAKIDVDYANGLRDDRDYHNVSGAT